MSVPTKATAIYGTVTATGVPTIFNSGGASFTVQNYDFTHYNLYLDAATGSFNGTVVLQVEGMNAVWQTPTTMPWTQPAAFTGAQVIFMDLPYQFLGLRINCTAFTSGTLNMTMVMS